MSLFTLMDEAVKRESRSAFIAMASFWFGAIKFLFSGAQMTLWGQTVNFTPVDPWLMVFFLGSAYGLYWGRRFTDVWQTIKGQQVPPGEKPQ